ncbi:MAG TPA: DNA polymerase III subunit delta [Azospirillaceae bacterium]|nr:DNA polymerase III subunit delta [Azospirillaceae bacterium]
MKLQGARIDAFLRKPDPQVRAVLLYGPDTGLVRERAGAMGRTVVMDLSDPFRVVTLPSSSVAADPAQLFDEAAAISMVGGRRLIRIRDAEERLNSAFTAFFKNPPPGDSLIIVEAGELDARSKLRAAFEHADHGVAIPCYVEESEALERVIGGIIESKGYTVDREAQEYLAAHLVGDRMVVRGELEKLTLYMGETKRITLDDVHACIGDSASLSLDDAVWAAADGDFPALDRALAKLYGEGVGPVGILRAAQRHMQRLHLVRAQVDRGTSAEIVVKGLKPPVFFKLERKFLGQVRIWSLPALAQSMERLTNAEADCKKTGLPDETLCARALFQIAMQARLGRR